MHKKERKKDDFNVATGMDYDVDSFSSWWQLHLHAIAQEFKV